jgi:hypothetical protein
LTPEGGRFLAVIRGAGFGVRDEAFALWPLDYELSQMRIKAPALGVPVLDPWTFLMMVRDALGGGSGVEPATKAAVERGLRFLASLYEDYRRLSPKLQILRQELPIQIAYSVAMATAFVSRSDVLPIPQIIDVERKRPKSRLSYRASRSLAGALVVRS